MITKQPKIDYKDVFAGLFFAFGYILFLVVLHILTIESVGNTASVLTTTFTVALRIFEVIGLFAIVFIIIHLLKWLVWTTTTPAWMKDKVNKK